MAIRDIRPVRLIRRRPRSRKIVVNFTIERDALRELRQIKDQHGISMSEIVNTLVQEYLKFARLKKYHVNLEKVAKNSENLISLRHNLENEDVAH